MNQESSKLIEFLKSGPCPVCGEINCPHIDSQLLKKNLNEIQELIDSGDTTKAKKRWMQLWGSKRRPPKNFDDLKTKVVQLPTIVTEAKPDKPSKIPEHPSKPIVVPP